MKDLSHGSREWQLQCYRLLAILSEINRYTFGKRQRYILLSKSVAILKPSPQQARVKALLVQAGSATRVLVFEEATLLVAELLLDATDLGDEETVDVDVVFFLEVVDVFIEDVAFVDVFCVDVVLPEDETFFVVVVDTALRSSAAAAKSGGRIEPSAHVAKTTRVRKLFILYDKLQGEDVEFH